MLQHFLWSYHYVICLDCIKSFECRTQIGADICCFASVWCFCQPFSKVGLFVGLICFSHNESKLLYLTKLPWENPECFLFDKFYSGNNMMLRIVCIMSEVALNQFWSLPVNINSSLKARYPLWLFIHVDYTELEMYNGLI